MPSHTFTVNGETVTVEAPDDLPLLWALRDLLGIRGPKYGCGIDVCKACTSHLDGDAFNPCQTPVSECDGRDVTTIEGLANGDQLHPVQEAWLDEDVSQCGYCQPGQIMAAVALVNAKGSAITEADLDTIRNICRCGTYVRIRSAVRDGATKM